MSNPHLSRLRQERCLIQQGNPAEHYPVRRQIVNTTNTISASRIWCISASLTFDRAISLITWEPHFLVVGRDAAPRKDSTPTKRPAQHSKIVNFHPLCARPVVVLLAVCLTRSLCVAKIIKFGKPYREEPFAMSWL